MSTSPSRSTPSASPGSNAVVDLEALLQSAVELHQRGDLAAAAAAYEQVLAHSPNDSDALHLLGLVRLAQGQHDQAIPLLDRAQSLDPSIPDYALNLGRALLAANRASEAAAAVTRAIERGAAGSEPFTLLGIALQQSNQIDQAKQAFQRALEINPSDVTAHHRLGAQLAQESDFPAAANHLQKAVALAPNFVPALTHLGGVLQALGDFQEALAVLDKAAGLAPRDADVQYNLGRTYHAKNQPREAALHYARALDLRPGFIEALTNLGNVYLRTGQFAQALECHQQAVRLNPEHYNARCNLAMDYQSLGMAEESLAEFRIALSMRPDDFATHSIVGVTMTYIDSIGPQDILHEFQEWDRRFAAVHTQRARPHTNDRNPDRPLKVGFVSGDLRQHPVGVFMEPLLEKIDRRNFQILCYPNGDVFDQQRDRLRALSDAWLDVEKLSDDELAEQIRADGVDILVDLAGHSADNRLLAFARKPAPVQVTYLGFPTTTGLSSMDWRIADSWTDPPGMTERFHTEKLWRLPDVFACYRGFRGAPLVSELPAEKNGHITFGSFNKLLKVTPRMLETWCQLLREIPNAKLMMVVDQGSQDRLSKFFARFEISLDRVHMVARLPIAEYFKLYEQIDIALDTFPFAGHTTTCDCLWMGVPVVTLAGNSALSRAGVSVLNNINLPELIATDDAGYIRAATRLAADISRLSNLRRTMRQRLQSSPLMNQDKFALEMGRALRGMWKAWCQSK